MKISSFDLNLFVIMNSIYTEGSLTKAAEVVGITQPAVSNALSRLREKFDDELFVRTGGGMVPTQKTENIIKDIQNALQLMQKSVNEPDEFDPATSQKTFRISLGDINEGRILAILMGKIEEQARRQRRAARLPDEAAAREVRCRLVGRRAPRPLLPRAPEVELRR